MTKPIAAVQRIHEISSYIIAGLALLFVMKLHLLPVLISGFLVYHLVHTLATALRATRLKGVSARIGAVALIATVIIILLSAGVWGLIALLHSGGGITGLFQKMAEIMERSLKTLPPWLSGYLPNETEGVRTEIIQWLRTHAGELQIIGREAGRTIAHVLIGIVLGALISLQEVRPRHEHPPLTQALVTRSFRFGEAFRSIVFAQVRISALNTIFAGFYLWIILPVAGIHLPLVKTMVALTFITGLLPVIGNLISNTVIVIVSLSHSLEIAIASLTYLVVIHKLEYFLNARIVSTRINARPWEILIAMLVMEAAFGIPGVIAAPIYYAYIKREFSELGMV